MKPALRRVILTAAVVMGNFIAAPFTLAPLALAAQFSQQEVNQDQFVVIAAPVGNQAAHQLLILEQVNNTRPCWQESGSNPTIVDPLLLDFDFSGICNRSIDSNGYSVRVGGQDLALKYGLRIVRRQNDLVLVAVPYGDRSAPTLEIGHTNGTTDGFARIELNSGWRITRRMYDRQPLGHLYLTHDQYLTTLVASAPQSQGAVSDSLPTVTVASAPLRPPRTRNNDSRPTSPPRPRENSAPVSPPRSSPSPRPTLPTPSRPPSSNPGASQGFNYRVIVPGEGDELLRRVRQIASDAFRTTIDGRNVVQAGLYVDRDDAEALERQLSRRNLEARILDIGEGVVALPRRSISSARSTSRNQSPAIPNIPNGRVVVAIDPGHGGADVGAVGVGGLQEAGVVLSIAQEVERLLDRQGIEAVLTREDDREIDLEPRVSFAERINATLFVSIHANSIDLSRPDINGVETYYYSSGASQRLAQTIQNSIIDDLAMVDRGVKQARFYVLTQTPMPAVLVEVGFVTGRDDAARLSSASFRSQMAEAIARGILQYMGRAN